MIVISGTIDFDPAATERANDTAAALVTATLAEEGCTAYGFYSSPSHPGRWRVFEEWTDAAALGLHMASPHMAAFLEAAGGLGISQTEIYRYDVTDKSRFM